MSIDAIAESAADSMTEAEMRDLLTSEGVGTLAFATDDLPYLLPVSFGYDGESTLYFVFLLFGAESRKETLANEPEHARFLTYRAESMYDWRSVSLAGPIEVVPEDEWDELRGAMANAWHSNMFSAAHPTRGVAGYQLAIEEWTGIKHQDLGKKADS